MTSEKAKKIFSENAKKSNVYAGRRFLGYTPTGKEVWITMEYLRNTQELSLRVDSGFNLLYHKDARLAPKRIDHKGTRRKKVDISKAIIENSKNAGGAVTLKTLEYIEKLLFAVHTKYSPLYVNGKPSSLLFSEVAWMVFPGEVDYLNVGFKGFRWNDVVEVWKLPRTAYVVIDSLPKFIDN